MSWSLSVKVTPRARREIRQASSWWGERPRQRSRVASGLDQRLEIAGEIAAIFSAEEDPQEAVAVTLKDFLVHGLLHRQSP